MILRTLSNKELKDIRDVVENTYGEETRNFLGDQKFDVLLSIPKDVNELEFLLRILDFSRNKGKSKPIEYNIWGERVDKDTRDYSMLEEAVVTTQLEYVSRVIDSIAKDYPYVKIILEELYYGELDYLNRNKDMSDEEYSERFYNLEMVKGIERDLEENSKDVVRYYNELNFYEGKNITGAYMFNLNLMKDGMTIKDLLER